MMNYSITNLTQVNDCNELLEWATQERLEREHRRSNQAFTSSRYTEVANMLREAYQSTATELEGVNAALAINLQGTLLATTLDRKRRLEFKMYLLEGRLSKYGTIPQIEKEVDLSLTVGELAEIDSFILLVQEHKNYLESLAQA